MMENSFVAFIARNFQSKLIKSITECLATFPTFRNSSGNRPEKSSFWYMISRQYV